MALVAKLTMRQGQSMVLTPQLLQAIKLLQMPNVELTAFIETELECNPLLERADDKPVDVGAFEFAESQGAPEIGAVAGDWASELLETDPATLAQGLGTEIENAFGPDSSMVPAERIPVGDGPALATSSWAGMNGRSSGESAADIASYVAATETLNEHLTRQAMIILGAPADRMIARALIDALDESGYLTEPAAEIAERLGASATHVEAVLARLQTLEPTGVFARDLAECLKLQLIERDRFDPAMRALVENLAALAKRDLAHLRRVCGVDEEDLVDMIGEIKRLDPKPGRGYGAPYEPPAIPDVFVTAAPNNAWRVELNTDALPRILINETYTAHVRRGATGEADKQYISTHLQSANWLTKSLEQRARTILNVASEIIRRQDCFLMRGVEGLRPLNLKSVADAIGVHESTVSRATSNKFIQTPRGLFEMKYFFTTSIASNTAGEAHSAETVRHKIKQMISAEDPNEVLSDDVIVDKLREANIVVARRTVAKYRDNLRIPSSVDRRRLKMSPFRAANDRDERLTL